MIEKNKLNELVHDWMRAWNDKDINRLMKHYDEHVEFSSPVVLARWGNTDGKLVGAEALKNHFLKGFEDRNHVRFELLGILAGTQGIVLVYRHGASGIAADVIDVDEKGKVLRVNAYKSIEGI